jgi:amino acid adenylation domain-containing protein
MAEVKRFETAVSVSKKNKERDYWLYKLSGDLVKSRFPYDNKKTEAKERRLESIEFTFPPLLSSRLLELSNNSHQRMHMVLAAALMVLLNKYTDDTDITLGTSILKQEPDLNFINTVLVLRNQFDPGIPFKELLLQVRQTVVEAVENQNYPINVLLNQLNLESSEREFPLFDIAILLDNIHDKKYIRHTQPDMIFSFLKTGNEVSGKLEYNILLYGKNTCERIINHYISVVQKVLFNPNLQVYAVEILSEEEKKQVLFDFNDTGRDYYSKDKTVHELFMEQAGKAPESTAVIYNDERLSYEALNGKSNRLARQLRKKGVGPGSIIPILFAPSVDLITALMGILKAGAAYLSIDLIYPRERIESILKDCSSRLLLIAKDDSLQLPDFPGEVLEVDVAGSETVKTNDASDIISLSAPIDPAYVIYTSGTTGKPKGIMLEHRSFFHFVSWAVEEYEHKPGYQVLLSNSYASDGASQQIFPPLVSGGTLHLVHPNVRLDTVAYLTYLRENHINNIDEVPALMKVLLEDIDPADENIEQLPHLTCLSLGGEYVPADLVRKCRKYLNHSGRIINGYGPAEASVETCTYHFDGWSEGENSLIGKPRRGLRVYILNSYGQCCPTMAPGEICVSGIGVARGYLNKPELTNEKFVKNTHSGIPFDILYKTGDKARWLTDGNIEFLGRTDNQVKIRGHRIELVEIESKLLQHDAIIEAVVIPKENERGQNYLNAYIVSNNEPPVSELRAFLLKHLPEYMVPSYFIFLDQIPLSANGKIDRKALPEPEIKPGQHGAYIEPRNEEEQKLVKIWSEVLGVRKDLISIDDHFFQLGGDSLKIISMMTKIHKEFNIKISLAEIFKTLTIERIALLIRGVY